MTLTFCSHAHKSLRFQQFAYSHENICIDVVVDGQVIGSVHLYSEIERDNATRFVEMANAILAGETGETEG